MKDRRTNTILLLLAPVYHFLVYAGGRALSAGRPHFTIATALDGRIPFLTGTVVIYLGCYLFWIGNYCLSVLPEPDRGRRFLLAHYLGEGVCFFVFLAVPTTMTRPMVADPSVFGQLVALVYRLDQPDNLLPSIHCFLSWLCWLGVKRRGDIPRWYQRFSLLFALMVCASTLTMKQHVLLDVAAGVLLAQVGWQAAGRILDCAHGSALALCRAEQYERERGEANG